MEKLDILNMATATQHCYGATRFPTPLDLLELITV